MWNRIFVMFVLAVTIANLAASAAPETPETVVRIFRLNHISVIEVSAAVEPLLSENGSFTVEPSKFRLTVQDSSEVVERVSNLVKELDRSPESYRIKIELLEGTSKILEAEEQVQVSSSLRNMYKFKAYRRLGIAVIEGEIGQPASANLGLGFRVSFRAESTAVSKQSPWGVVDPGLRLNLIGLTLVKIKETTDGHEQIDEVLSTNVFLAPKQEVYLGAGRSEKAPSGLVLIVNAQVIGGS